MKIDEMSKYKTEEVSDFFAKLALDAIKKVPRLDYDNFVKSNNFVGDACYGVTQSICLYDCPSIKVLNAIKKHIDSEYRDIARDMYKDEYGKDGLDGDSDFEDYLYDYAVETVDCTNNLTIEIDDDDDSFRGWDAYTGEYIMEKIKSVTISSYIEARDERIIIETDELFKQQVILKNPIDVQGRADDWNDVVLPPEDEKELMKVLRKAAMALANAQ